MQVSILNYVASKLVHVRTIGDSKITKRQCDTVGTSLVVGLVNGSPKHNLLCISTKSTYSP